MPKPSWLKIKLPQGPHYEKVRRLLATTELNTVCQEARCPNQWECFSHETATFLILGTRCSRNCRFCAIEHGRQSPVDPTEPGRVTETAAHLGLSYVVLTSVCRDDLADGGASAFANTISCLKNKIPKVRVEVLIPDFNGNLKCLQAIVAAKPDIINHNVETVPRLYNVVRPQASYEQSLAVLDALHTIAPDIPTKSGIMLGLGESTAEIEQVLSDLLKTGCKLLTIGQYLQPSHHHLPVQRYITPQEFQDWQEHALAAGFEAAACGPLVRSSYKASFLAEIVIE